VIVLVLLAAVLVATPAWAMDVDKVFARDTVVITGEFGGGWQDNFSPGRQSGLEFFNVGLRFSLLPLPPLGAGVLRGALEMGLEPFYQGFVEPQTFHLGGVKAVFRYHFLSLGRVVPYVEIIGGAAGTDLDVPEASSAFAFVLEGGPGVSIFLTDTLAVTVGYRLHHISNGNTSERNRGIEAHTAVLGLSLFLGKGSR
jgi:opacity protein-like surface antigen